MNPMDQYGCTLCGWEGPSTEDEAAAYAESEAHYASEAHFKNVKSQPTDMPDGVGGEDYNFTRLHQRRLAEILPVPDGPVYPGRTLQAVWITKVNDGAVQSSEGWWVGVSQEVADLLPVGKPAFVETMQGSRVTGWAIDGQWYDRKSDDDLARERAEWQAKWAAEKRVLLEANRAEWQAKEDALPDWIKARMDHFHTVGGTNFELNGWGYELTIAELAVLYDAMPDLMSGEHGEYPDTPETNAYGQQWGTSGNQHALAFVLAKMHRTDPDKSLAGTIGGMTPISGEPFYAAKGT